MSKVRFNPLNQVYVFNTYLIGVEFNRSKTSFNPLNQVYVFNCKNLNGLDAFIDTVLIP